MVEFITIGKIPENSKSLIIYCGDYASDDTIEFSFCIKNNKIIGIDNEFSCDIAEEIFKPNSSVLAKLSNYIKPLGIELSTNSIYNGVNLLIHKKSYLFLLKRHLNQPCKLKQIKNDCLPNVFDYEEL